MTQLSNVLITDDDKVQSRFSDTLFSDNFAEDHFFSTKKSHLVTIWYFLPPRFSDTNLGFFGQKCHF